MFTTDQIKSLNDLELSVYQFLMDYPDQVRYMKIRELAEAAHVSTTTVMHFCRKMGCDGYTEFRLKLKQYLREDKRRQAVSEDATEIIDCLKKISTEEFEEQIESLIQVIYDASRVIFVGSGMSGIVAKYGARYFSSIGKFTLCVDEPHYPTVGQIFENAVIIVCSVSGESNDVIGHVNRFKQKNCRIISLTNTKNCTIAKMSDYNIAYYTVYVRLGIYDITTQIPAMYLIEQMGRRLYNKIQKENTKKEND